MAIIKVQIRPPEGGYGNIVHPETDSTQVLMGDGQNLEAFKIAINLLVNSKADSAHNHDTVYATKTHNHSGVYATATHNHTGVYATAAQGTLATNAVPKTGVIMEGALVAQNNVNYNTKQMRNVVFKTGSDFTTAELGTGDIGFVY